ncbi:MAG: squalene/phytoene synthase family protein, partial [Alphaproteobacteria bacterium]|nr:squalene/phytoene synthase family protein [Alphaproteobacteria bacterium]
MPVPSSAPSQAANRRSGGLGPVPAVAETVRQHDRERYLTVLFAPMRHRNALFALYAFNYEIARVRESVHEPMLGQIRLQWWREAIAAAYGDGAPRRHLVVEPLTATIREYRLDRTSLDRLIDARERDLDDAPPPDTAALEAYAEGSAAALIYLALEVLGAATPPALAAARHIGIAYALSGLIRALPLHAAAGRLWIPADVAAAARLEPRDYGASRAGAALRQAVETLAREARRHLVAARARPAVPAAALPALLSAAVADRALRRLER